MTDDTAAGEAIRIVHDRIPIAKDDAAIAALVGEWLDLIPEIPGRDVGRIWTMLWPTVEDLRLDLGTGRIDLLPDSCRRVAQAVAHVAPRIGEAERWLRVTLHWMTSDPAPRCRSLAGGTFLLEPPFGECQDPMALKPFFEACLAHRVRSAQDLASLLAGCAHVDLVPDLVPTAPRGEAFPDATSEPDQVLGRREAAELLGWTPHTLSTRKSEGKLPADCIVDGRRGRTTYSRNGLLRLREVLGRRGG